MQLMKYAVGSKWGEKNEVDLMESNAGQNINSGHCTESNVMTKQSCCGCNHTLIDAKAENRSIVMKQSCGGYN